MKNRTLLVFGLLLLLANVVFAQPINQNLYHFKFKISNKSEIDQITQIISIDNVINDTVYAYANDNELNNFKKLNKPYEFITETKADKSVTMATTLAEMQNWNKYPTYEVFVALMQKFAADYPNICVLEEIGTLPSGRKLLALKISDTPNLNTENEPKILLSSTIHGDEIAGYALLLRLADYLLSNAANNSIYKIEQLITQSEIWICPLANPDGTYNGGNSSLNSAIRYNGSFVDLNRNFPDPAVGENPDGYEYQPETKLMMAFANKHKFALGINIHGGAEVVNYPWDTWYKRSADNNWWKYVGANYRDSAQKNSPAGYLTGISNGLTNGYDWYRITGGRQDYMNYYHRCREFTLEISNTKLYPASALPNLWNYNRGALMGYMLESLNGIHGNVINEKGLPVFAKIEILNYDKDNSDVFTDSLNGFFTRYLKAGIYKLKISSAGYINDTIENITVVDGKNTSIKQIMTPVFSKICIENKEIIHNSYSLNADSLLVPITNCGNQTETFTVDIQNFESNSWISVQNNAMTLAPQQTKNLILKFSNSFKNDTAYSCNLIIGTNPVVKINVTVNFKPKSKLKINLTEKNYTLTTNSTLRDTLVIQNLTGNTQQVSFTQANVAWLKVDSQVVSLKPTQSYKAEFEITTTGLAVGQYTTYIEINNGFITRIPVNLLIDTLPIIETQYLTQQLKINKNDILNTAFIVVNKGGGISDFELKITDNDLANKITLTPSSGTLNKYGHQSIAMNIKSENFAIGNCNTSLTITSNSGQTKLPLTILIDSLSKLYVNTDTIRIFANQKGLIKDSLKIENIGGGQLNIKASESILSNNKRIVFPAQIFPVPQKSQTYLPFVINVNNLNTNEYKTNISINNSTIPVLFTLIDNQNITLNKYCINKTLVVDEVATDTLIITNNSSKPIAYIVENYFHSVWFKTNAQSGTIEAGKWAQVIIYMDAKGLTPDNYLGKIVFETNSTMRIPVTLKIVETK